MTIKFEPNEGCSVEIERTEDGILFGAYLKGFDFDKMNLNAMSESDILKLTVSSIVNMVDTIANSVHQDFGDEIFYESIKALGEVGSIRQKKRRSN